MGRTLEINRHQNMNINILTILDHIKELHLQQEEEVQII